MVRASKIAAALGCFLCVAGALLALILYSRARWLFALALIGLTILIALARLSKGPLPAEIAGRAERLLDGRAVGWDVDDYEHTQI